MNFQLQTLQSNEPNLDETIPALRSYTERMTRAEMYTMLEALASVQVGKAGKLALPDFNSRPVFIDPKPGESIPSDAIVVATSYPYGRKRCLRAMWLQYSENDEGSRIVSITSGFGMRWNKPNTTGTYHKYSASYFVYDDDEHVAVRSFDVLNAGIKGGYSSPRTYHPENVESFLLAFRFCLSEREITRLENEIILLTKKRDAQAEIERKRNEAKPVEISA